MSGTLQLPRPTWFVGCGNMGKSIIDGWRSAGIDLSQLVVIDPVALPIDAVRKVDSFPDAGIPPKLIVLGFKPQSLEEAAPQLKPWITSRTTILSILAGVEVGTLRQRFINAGAIVRVMPNLPVSIRRGVTALYSADADEALKQQIGDLFAALGWAMWTVDEGRLAAIGSVAGAGPAYAARFVRALAKAGEAAGLSPEIASTVALETVLGTAWMAASANETMDDVVKRVASPGGTTEAGLAVLDQALDDLVRVTVDAASRRGAQLAEETRSA